MFKTPISFEAEQNYASFNRCRYRRLDMFKIQLLITASVINLKRLMKKRVNRNNEPAISKKAVFYYTAIIMLLFKFSRVW